MQPSHYKINHTVPAYMLSDVLFAVSLVITMRTEIGRASGCSRTLVRGHWVHGGKVKLRGEVESKEGYYILGESR